MSDSPETGVEGVNTLSQKVAEAKICTIIRLYIHFSRIVTQADLMRSLAVRVKRSISGTCYFLDVQFRFIQGLVLRQVTNRFKCMQ